MIATRVSWRLGAVKGTLAALGHGDLEFNEAYNSITISGFIVLIGRVKVTARLFFHQNGVFVVATS